MEKILTFDKQGRLYLPEELRKYLQFKTFIARFQGKGLYLQPIEEDPIESLSKLGKDKLKGKPITQLKKEARAEIEKNATKNIRGY
ncbi:AbrB family transcriptional regulator [Candidatus Pacearchaeota archaeon]|nr:AbrB family transcriptional regulator [Candidatus Pacearchaeota archaeon]